MGSKRSWACAGDLVGARAGKPRWFKILAITLDSMIAVMIFIVPPQYGRCSMSISNTCFKMRVQLIRTEAEECGTSSFASDALLL